MRFLEKYRRAGRKVRPVIILAVLLALSLFFRYESAVVRDIDPEEVHFSVEDVRELFPGAEYITFKAPEVYRVKSAGDELLGFVAHGPPPDERIIGYAGEVPFLAGIDTSREITGVHMLPSRETPYYAEKVSESLEAAWTGLEPREAYGEPVDAVSGATCTSLALIEGVRKTMAGISGAAYENLSRRALAFDGLPVGDLLVLIFLAAALSYFFLPVFSSRLKSVLNVLGFLIPGVLTANLLSLAVFENWLRGYFSPRAHWLMAIVAVLSAGIPLFMGRNFYCYNFCPFGCAQELVGKLNRKKIRPGRRINRVLRIFRILLLVSAAAALFLRGAVDLYLLEPFVSFRWAYAPVFSRILAVFFLALAAAVPRPWCRICPTGGLLEGLKLKKRDVKR